jgi:hypothetical protein
MRVLFLGASAVRIVVSLLAYTFCLGSIGVGLLAIAQATSTGELNY